MLSLIFLVSWFFIKRFIWDFFLTNWCKRSIAQSFVQSLNRVERYVGHIPVGGNTDRRNQEQSTFWTYLCFWRLCGLKRREPRASHTVKQCTCWNTAGTLCKFCIYQDMRWLCMLTWYLNPSHHFDEHWLNVIFKVILFLLGDIKQLSIFK